MPMKANLKLDEVRDLYGHDITDNQIESLYPYDNGRFCKEKYKDKCFTVTYDPHTALVLRTNNVPIVIWGQRYKNYRAFVFKKERPKATLF